MTIKHSASAAALTLLLAACGQQQNPSVANREVAAGNPATSADSVYPGTGTVKSIVGDQMAIAHGPISGIGWPAMTMTFTAPPGIAGSVRVGDKVDFSFRKDGNLYVLTSAKRP